MNKENPQNDEFQEVIDTISTFDRVEASPALFNRVLAGLESPVVEKTNSRIAGVSTLILLLLIGFNVFTLFSSLPSNSSASAAQEMVSEYGLELENSMELEY